MEAQDGKTFFDINNRPEKIEKAKIVKGEECQRATGAEIICVKQGSIECGWKETKGKQLIKEGQIAFFPPGSIPHMFAKEHSLLLIFRLDEYLPHLGEPGKKAKTEENNTWSPLTMKGQLHAYMEYLSACMDEGFCGSHFHAIKIEELLLLLKGYYKEEERASFFGPQPAAGTQFAYFIYANYNKVKTVKELASKANLSLSSFDKEFRRVFRIAPYRWMKQKKTENIYNEVCYGRKPLKVISEEYGFSSPSQMNDYCKKEFGMPPGKIRESYTKKEHEL